MALHIENKDEMVLQLMLLTFGKKWEKEIKEFIGIYYAIKQASCK